MADTPPSTLLPNLLGSSVLATVLTILGTIVTTRVQDNAKRNEIAVAEFRESQAARAKTFTEALNLIGPYMTAVDDLITLTDSHFKLANYSDSDKPKLEKFLNDTQTRHDEADVTWRSKRYAMGFLLTYHYGGRKEVADHWASLVENIDAFDDCATGWLKDHGRGSSDLRAERPCTAQRKKAEAAISNLAVALKDNPDK